MSDSSIDVLMRVVSNGQAMQAECTTTFVRGTAPDILGLGFKAGQFCELTSFDFSVGFASSLGDDDDDDEGEDGSAPDAKPSAPPKVKQAKSGPTEFSDIQPVGFTRLMDTMSTLLFKAMTECETLELDLGRQAQGRGQQQLRRMLPAARFRQGPGHRPDLAGQRGLGHGERVVHLPRRDNQVSPATAERHVGCGQRAEVDDAGRGVMLA